MATQNQTVSTEGELISEKAVLRLMNYIKAEAEGKSYTLPVASNSTLGGVKIGEGINISEDGTISAPNDGGSTPPAQDINDFLKIIAPTFSNLVDYSAGDLCIYQGELCKCVIDHSAGEWDDTHFGVTNLANEILNKN